MGSQVVERGSHATLEAALAAVGDALAIVPLEPTETGWDGLARIRAELERLLPD